MFMSSLCFERVIIPPRHNVDLEPADFLEQERERESEREREREREREVEGGGEHQQGRGVRGRSLSTDGAPMAGGRAGADRGGGEKKGAGGRRQGHFGPQFY
jgi:hypothetical protein